jgi:phage terminase small subunit
MALRKKQRVFVEQYVLCWNATEAARRAGYSLRTARSIGSENLSKPDIQAYIEQLISELQMGPDEVKLRLAEQARGAAGLYIQPTGDFDFARLIEDGKQHLIKSVSITETKDGGSKKVEFYDAQAALVHIGRHYKLFTNVTENTTTLSLEGLGDLLERVYGDDAPPEP